MAAGLQIVNDSGIVQIDENYFNFEFKYKFQYAIAAGINQYTIGTNGYSNEVVAVGETGVGYVNISRTASNQIVITTFATSATTLTFYVFGTPDQSTNGNAGMQIFNSAGQIIFSYTRSYMRVVYSYRTTDNVQSTGGANAVTLGGGTYAAINSSNRRLFMQHVPPYTGPPYALLIDAVRVNGSYIDATPQWKIATAGQGSWQTLYRNDTGGWVTVFDVSGL